MIGQLHGQSDFRTARLLLTLVFWSKSCRLGVGVAALTGHIVSSSDSFHILSFFFVVARNLHRRLPDTLLVTLIYFVAAGGVSSTFVSSFTFDSFNNTMTTSTSLNAITTAVTKVPNPLNVSSCISY
jgi:hypothetical protein